MMKSFIDSIIAQKELMIKTQMLHNKNNKKQHILILLANDLDSSAIYIRNKINKLESFGFEVTLEKIDKEWATEGLVEYVDTIKNFYSGIFLQLPTWSHIDSQAVIESIPVNKDIDRLTEAAMGQIMVGSSVLPCTVRGVLDIMEHYFIYHDLPGLNVAVLGRSNIVGLPLVNALIKRGCTVTSINSKSDISKINWDNFDCVVTATGQIGSVKTSYFAPDKNALIIDVGINKNEDGKLCGDVLIDSENQLSITPVPGGVGRLTVLNVAYNAMVLGSV